MTRAQFLLLFLGISASAQSLPKEATVKGIFHLNVDDGACIFINGVEAHRSTGLGKSKSKEIGIKPGDRIVVQLRNASNPRYFIMAFSSSDKTAVVSFPRQSFKLLTDPEAKDFAAEGFSRMSKHPKAQNSNADTVFPFKHKSDYVWGEFDECALGCIVTQQMFTPMRFQ
jgi:hypothetical protein